MTETDLERDLVAIGDVLDVPADPFLVTRVAAAAASSRRGRRLTLVVAAVVVGVVVLSQTPVVAGWLRVGGIEIRQAPPPTSAVPPPAPYFGMRVSLDEARGAVDFPIVVPAALGRPDDVFVDRAAGATIVWLAYRARPDLPAGSTPGYGALLAQVRAPLADDVVATKFVQSGTTIEPVDLGRGRAVWIAGVHFIVLRAGGAPLVDELRISDRVLLWERDEVTLRFESTLDRDAAVRIVRSAS